MALVPWWLKALAIAAALALVTSLAAWGVRTYNEGLRQEGRDEILAQQREDARIGQRAEDNAAAARRKKEKEAEDATAAALTVLAGNVADSRAAASRLQQRVDELKRGAGRAAPACGATGAPAPGEPGADPIGMFAHMLERVDAAAGRIGQYADALRIAGAGCEARFDAVTSTQLSPRLPEPGPQDPGSP